MIYLDNNATTQPLPEVIEAVGDALQRFSGNPSSPHSAGVAARRALESARDVVSHGFGADDWGDVMFTSCGTESINTAFSLFLTRDIAQVIVSTAEHSAVLRAADRWRDLRPLRHVPVSSDGVLDLDKLAEHVAASPSFVSLVLANNETGVIAEIAAAGEICRRFGAILHVDAVQAAGKMAFSLAALDCDAASLSAHKFHGPRGCGVLFVRRRGSRFAVGRPLLSGHQENGLRGGTENLPAIVGAAVAVESFCELHGITQRIAALRDGLETQLLRAIAGSEVHGARANRLPNTISFFCPYRDSAEMVRRLDQAGVAASAGAACSTGGAPSHVIQAMGLSAERASCTIRFSLSRFTTTADVTAAARIVADAYHSALTLPRCA